MTRKITHKLNTCIKSFQALFSEGFIQFVRDSKAFAHGYRSNPKKYNSFHIIPALCASKSYWLEKTSKVMVST